MTISILGCGWFGLPFGRKILKQGYTVKGSTTSKDKLTIIEESAIEPYLIDLSPGATTEINKGFFNCDILVIAIPPKLRSNPAENYLSSVGNALSHIRQAAVKKVIFISSTSVFGDENRNVKENEIAHPDTDSGKVLVLAEQLFRTEPNVKTTIVRFAGLVGPGRDPGRFFAGKTKVPNGRAPVNLIHINDCCGICEAIISNDAFGNIIHACSPDHPTRKEFYTQASKAAGLELPEFIDELVSWKIVETLHSDKLLSYRYQTSIFSRV